MQTPSCRVLAHLEMKEEGDAYEMEPLREYQVSPSSSETAAFLKNATLQRGTILRNKLAVTAPEPTEAGQEDGLKIQDSTYVELALRVLGLMCDGQNRTLQVWVHATTQHFMIFIVLGRALGSMLRSSIAFKR